MNNGQITASFGKKTLNLLSSKYEVYYDHGKKNDPNVYACKGVIGSDLNNKSRLSDIDIVIVSGDKVKVLIEIEESGILSPKKLLGDYIANAIIEKVFIKDRSFDIDIDTVIIIGGLINLKGSSEEKINKIESKLTQVLSIKKKIIIIKKPTIADLLISIEDIIKRECA